MIRASISVHSRHTETFAFSGSIWYHGGMRSPTLPAHPRPLCVILVASALLTSHFALGQAEPHPHARNQITDLSALPDQSSVLQKQIDDTGALMIPPGRHRITKTLEINLARNRSTLVGVRSSPTGGSASLIMDGPGPAIRIVGSHEGTAGPSTFEATTWNESMPRIEGIEIIGNHLKSVGIELVRCVQPVVSEVAIRWCLHGVHLRDRNRNVILSDLQIYENSGVGVFLDDVNLHQINVSNSHISYNRTGGIVVRDGNVRNLHITGCDLEANMPADDSETTAANIVLDVSGSPEDKSRSIAEVAITGCTIQHSSNYGGKKYESLAPGGANVRILGKAIWPIDSVAITGNVMSDTSVLLDISRATDITISGNTFFAPNPDFLHAADSKRLVITGNTWNPRQFDRPGRLRFERCDDSILSQNTFRALAAEDGAIQIKDCQRILATGNILTESQSGITIEKSQGIVVKSWIASGLPEGSTFLKVDSESEVTENP